MKWYWSILLTIALFGIPFIVSLTGADDSATTTITTALVGLSAVWVGIDSRSFGPGLWVLLFWPIAFPIYLINREPGVVNARMTLSVVAVFVLLCVGTADPVRTCIWNNIATTQFKTEYHRRKLKEIRQSLNSNHMGFGADVQPHVEKLVELGCFFRKKYRIPMPAESRYAYMTKAEHELCSLITHDIMFSGGDGVLGGEGWVKSDSITDKSQSFIAYDLKEREPEYDEYFESLRAKSTNLPEVDRRARQLLALERYSESIERNPDNVDTYHRRAHSFQSLQRWDEAIADFAQAIELDPDGSKHSRCLAKLYNSRAWDLYRKADFSTAMLNYDEAIELDPELAAAYNNRAWLRATCPRSRWRDGGRAIEDASRACDLTNWENASYIDTLAAAHAEAGDFAQAAEWEVKAIDISEEDNESNRRRLEQYRSGKPYRSELMN